MVPPTDGSAKWLVRCKVLSGPITDVENSVQIHASLATLFFLKLVQNWPKIAVLNFALYCGAIWRRIEKLQYRCTTIIHRVHNISKDVLENLLPLWLLVCTNLFIPSRFWTTFTNFDTCCQRYVAICGKKLYRCTSTFSALNYCNGIFFKSLSYLYEVVRTNFSANF